MLLFNHKNTSILVKSNNIRKNPVQKSRDEEYNQEEEEEEDERLLKLLYFFFVVILRFICTIASFFFVVPPDSLRCRDRALSFVYFGVKDKSMDTSPE